jgi:hypothetical protein
MSLVTTIFVNKLKQQGFIRIIKMNSNLKLALLCAFVVEETVG